jgi:uncharacterized protein YajQ (UPF0234 family)
MPSFDIVSRTDLAEVDNAVRNIQREIGTRFDFKGSKSSIERKDEVLTVVADDDLKLKQIHELIKAHFTRRGVDPAALEFKDPEKASGNLVRQTILVRQGVDSELAKRIVKELNATSIGVPADIDAALPLLTS